MEIIFYIFLYGFLALIVFLTLYRPIRYLYYKCTDLIFWIRLKKQSNSAEGFRLKGDAKYYDEILQDKISYYRTLSNASKTKFLNRINRFIYSKKFIGKEGFEVDLETQVLISAAAIQLTFGLKNYFFSSFTKIYVYPDSFYYRPGGKYHKGNTATQDFINLSYKHFLEGYENSQDKINLGLHEMTHALEFNYLFGSTYDHLFADFYDSWTDLEEIEFDKMKLEKDHFLRKYAKANIHEFFAVSVEHFFEDPASFKDTAPELYYRLCTLLNQDPLNTYGDFSLSRASNKIYHIKRNVLNRSGHWSYSIMLSGIFLGILAIFYLVDKIDISTAKIILLVLCSAVTGAILQYTYFKKNYWPGVIHFIMYNLFGFGIWFTFLILLGNRLIETDITDTSFYQVDRIYYNTIEGNSADVRVCKITHEAFQAIALLYEDETIEIDYQNIRLLLQVLPKDDRQIDFSDCIEPKVVFELDQKIMGKTLLISRTKGLFGFYVIKRLLII